jgi:hypothetical protein
VRHGGVFFMSESAFNMVYFGMVGSAKLMWGLVR